MGNNKIAWSMISPMAIIVMALRGECRGLKNKEAMMIPTINVPVINNNGWAAFQWAFDFSIGHLTTKLANFFFGYYAVSIDGLICPIKK